jgi:hypothetical protein
MSKLNPQKASAYVGPGVLRKGGKITPVPNGPLIKKKGPYAGSTLRSGGNIKKAQNGDTLSVKKPTWQQMTQAQRAAIKTELGPEKFKTYKDSVSTDATNRREAILNRNAAARGMTRAEVQAEQKKSKNKYIQQEGTCDPNFSSTKCGVSKAAAKESKSDWKKKKNGGLIKRADGSMSKRGLWDNIRANKGSGKKPTKQMLVQEKKIKAKTKK